MNAMSEYNIKLWELNHVNDFKKLYDFKGKNVLEIGGKLPKHFVNTFGVKSWTSIDLVNGNFQDENYREIQGNIADYNFEENTFDLVFSTNCFEHIINLEAAFLNMHKALKPGGLLSALFGPIWSGNIGHHIYLIHPRTNEIIYFNDCPIPEWSHLYFSHEQLIEILKTKFTDDIIDEIIEQTFFRNDKNRLFYEDYIRIINNSEFNINELRNWHEPINPPEEIQKIMEEKHPNKKNFSTRSLKIILQKNF